MSSIARQTQAEAPTSLTRHAAHACVLLWLVVVLGLGGCASIDVRRGIDDATLAERATVPGLPGARFWGDEVPKDLMAEVRRRLPNLPQLGRSANRVNGRPVIEMLALSGGGRDGAFGAGLLAGWSARGDRPEFEVVTGISAGAIIAPFAFLGPNYDDELKEVWTAYRTSQLVVAQIVPGLLGGSALADTAPLAQLMERYIDRTMMRRIARAYARGRILLIGTTNLDAQRPVVWNMGEIAASRHPEAIDLFRKVILASAAIPGAFPPVKIPVEVDGRRYDELHVDGGTTREVFVSPVQVPFTFFDALYDRPPIRRIYVIKNGKVTPETNVVQAQTLSIAARAIDTLLKSQSQGDVYRIWREALDAGATFKFAAVPADFNGVSNEFFDPPYQRALFDEGFRVGRAAAWSDKPPTAHEN